MKKKLIIISGVILGIVAVLVILCFTLFAVRKVEIDFRTSKSESFPSEEQILEAGQFGYGTPVFFTKKNQYKANIEQTYPYVEVINIETVFPNKLVVHIRERQEIYAFIHENKTYFCDNNLVVLRSEENGEYTSLQSNAILLENLDFGDVQIKVGSKLTAKNYVDFYNAFLTCNRQLYEQKSMIKSIKFDEFTDENINQTDVCAYVQTFDEHEFEIYNCSQYLIYKVQKFIMAYSGLYEYIGKIITTDEESEFYGQVWTKELLDQAQIVINNKYQTQGGLQSCYIDIIPR